jgi:hypothetical protein
MHGPINVKILNNTSKWQLEFNSAFKGLKYYYTVIFLQSLQFHFRGPSSFLGGGGVSTEHDARKSGLSADTSRRGEVCSKMAASRNVDVIKNDAGPSPYV